MPHYDVGNLNILFLALETYRSPLVRLYACHVCIPFFSISGRQRRPRAGVQPQWTQLAVGGGGISGVRAALRVPCAYISALRTGGGSPAEPVSHDSDHRGRVFSLSSRI